MSLDELRTARGQALLARADELIAEHGDRAALELRREITDPALAAEVLRQAHLRRLAAGKFGVDAGKMFFTRDGVEQASRAIVARRRAARLRAAGVRTAADLCCGIGGDAIALARAGIEVLAVDSDPETADIAAANAQALGLSHLEVRCHDALAVELSGRDAMFADPARRVNGARVFDPERYNPPLSRLWEASTDAPQRVCKVGPGIAHEVIPSDAEAEWVSVDGSVVEAALWRGPVATVARRASLLHGETAAELTGSGTRQAEVGDIGQYLYEPDGAVIRSHLVAELADELGAWLAHPDIAYLYSDSLVVTPFATAFTVEEVLPFHVKKLRQLVKQRGVGDVTVKKRGADINPDKLRRELKPSGDNAVTLIITRDGEKHVALWTQRVQPTATPKTVPTR